MTMFKKIWAAALAWLLCLQVAGMPSAHGITVQQELELSREFMKVVRQRYALIDDPYINRYVDRIGQALLAEFPAQPFPYHFHVVKQEVYNAFAGPGGQVFIHSGLLEAMDSESELAGILCHEISHVACRHISERIERSSKIEIGTLAGLAAGILLGAAGAGEAASALTIGSMAAGQSVSLAYSREDEREADQVGLKYLVSAGYSIGGLLEILEKIKAKNWYGSEIPSYLGTHPAVEERIVYLSRHLDQWGGQAPSQQKSGGDFDRFRTRLLALYGDEAKALSVFSKRAEKDPADFLADYGRGLIALRSGDRQGAMVHLRKALEKRAFDPFLLTDLGHVYLLDGDFAAAIKPLEAAVGLDGENPMSRLLLGQARLALGDVSDARRVLERLVADYPEYARTYYVLGEAWDKSGRPAEAHYYLGRYYMKTGDYQKAMFNLKRAEKAAGEEALKKKIAAAIEELQPEKEKEAARKKNRPENELSSGP